MNWLFSAGALALVLVSGSPFLLAEELPGGLGIDLAHAPVGAICLLNPEDIPPLGRKRMGDPPGDVVAIKIGKSASSGRYVRKALDVWNAVEVVIAAEKKVICGPPEGDVQQNFKVGDIVAFQGADPELDGIDATLKYEVMAFFADGRVLIRVNNPFRRRWNKLRSGIRHNSVVVVAGHLAPA